MDMFERYSSPVHILNLVKIKEKTPRESKVGVAYSDSVNYINAFLPPSFQLRYMPLDFSGLQKELKHSQGNVKFL